MRKRTLWLLMTAAVALSALAFQIFARQNAQTKKKETEALEWHTFDKGYERALKEKKLLVVDFYTAWCHWCKVMDRETYGNKSVIDYARQNAILAKVDAETDEKYKFKDASYSGRELSMMFGVRGFPTTSFMNEKGELLTSVSGYIPADRFLVILKYFAGNWYDKMSFDEFQKKQQAPGQG